jgi:hypothetical protein
MNFGSLNHFLLFNYFRKYIFKLCTVLGSIRPGANGPSGALAHGTVARRPTSAVWPMVMPASQPTTVARRAREAVTAHRRWLRC